MDYRALLKKYMDLVIAEESISFLYRVNEDGTSWREGEPFTPEELAELTAIEVELGED